MQLDHRIAEETQEVFQVQLDERIAALVDERIGAQLGTNGGQLAELMASWIDWCGV